MFRHLRLRKRHESLKTIWTSSLVLTVAPVKPPLLRGSRNSRAVTDSLALILHHPWAEVLCFTLDWSLWFKLLDCCQKKIKQNVCQKVAGLLFFALITLLFCRFSVCSSKKAKKQKAKFAFAVQIM